VAGESARQQYERLREQRRARLRDNRAVILGGSAVLCALGAIAFHLMLGAWWMGLMFGAIPLMDLIGRTRDEDAWRKGALGEETVGKALDSLGGYTRALHDRLIPGSKANIDHVLVASTGVWTIDAKNYTGKLEVRQRGQELWVNGRNRTKLVKQAQRQAEVVRRVLAREGLAAVPVTPALCFLGVQWPTLLAPSGVADVQLVSPRGLRNLAEGHQVLTVAQMVPVLRALERHLAPATDAAAPPATPGPARAIPIGYGDEPAPAPPTTAPGPTPPAAARHLQVRPWKRYGKHRLYVNHPDGTTIGYVDLQTNEVVPQDPRDRHLVADAVAHHLRNT
jgi:hypothetical protein